MIVTLYLLAKILSCQTYLLFWLTSLLVIFQNPGTVAPATNSRLSPLPPEPVGFNYGHGATVDIPLDSNSGGSKSKVFEIFSVYYVLYSTIDLLGFLIAPIFF